MTQNALLIYNQLRNSGLSEAGALGLMGNWMAESGLEPNRVEGDFAPGRLLSTAYVDDLKQGRLGKAQFARDQKGFGLAQWTYFSRKEALYDFWKSSGAEGIDDLRMQVEFAVHELSTGGEYAALWNVLKTTDDIWTATDKICRQYERPYYNNVDSRYQYAKVLEKELMNAGEGQMAEEPIPAPAQPSPAVESYWPPRMVDKNMKGPDVAALQGLLYARGRYQGELNGEFDDKLENAVRGFQTEHGLTVDGIVGPQTWGALLGKEAG